MKIITFLKRFFHTSSSEIKDDWRLQGQGEYLKGVALVWAKYTLYREGWDHDHCEFCWVKFSLYDGDLHEGYATPDRYRWICKQCYEDFKEMFRWKLVEDNPATATESKSKGSE